MTREEYEGKLDGNIFMDDILPIFSYFEKLLDEDIISDCNSIATLVTDLNNKDILKLIDCLKTNLYQKQRNLIASYCSSLYQNVLQFINKSNIWGLNKMKPKWKKVLLSYINLSRLIVDDNKIQRAILQQDSSLKIILCVSTINIEDDDVRVNNEIANIQEINNQNPNEAFLIIPIHGCSFNQFKNQVEKYNITHIHIAGHSSPLSIFFLDDEVTYIKLYNFFTKLNRHFNMLFLNCCFTYEYLKRLPFPYFDTTICHEEELDGTTAYDASNIFYTQVFYDESVNNAWTMVMNSIEDNMYHMLHL